MKRQSRFQNFRKVLHKESKTLKTIRTFQTDFTKYSDTLKRIILVRHGESITNLDLSEYRNYKDLEVPLSENGRKQAKESADSWVSYCQSKNFSSVQFLHSQSLRAKETAEIMASVMRENFSNVKSKEVSDIYEQKWPDCLGMHPKELNLYLQDCLQARHDQGIYNYTFPKGGENGFEVSKRAVAFIEELRAKYVLESADVIIVVTHSYFMRILLKELFNWSIDFFEQIRKPENCKGYELVFANGIVRFDSKQLEFKATNEMD